MIQKSVDNADNTMLSIKDPFTFEFLGLDAKDAVSESDLEQALMDHLQEFMLELGQGFCFEARQKRVIIDDKYYFIDIVFYNRILHCNVIIELKNDEFKHEDLGQSNAYVGYYKKNEMHEGDNPPVGILLCTDKGSQMVEYALSGMDNQLFASTYMLHLPDKKKLEEFIRKEMEEKKLLVKDIIIEVIIALAIAAMFAMFVGQPVVVQGQSMENTYHDGQYLFMEKISYRLHNIHRFDIVAFKMDDEVKLIKRVIGLPGETVQIMDDGSILINGQVMKENFGKEQITDAGDAANEIQLGEDEYFVLGDNRNKSMDSRNSRVGIIKYEDIIGTILFGR